MSAIIHGTAWKDNLGVWVPKEGRVRTWVKKGSYVGDEERATNPSRQVSSAGPAGECEPPNLHSGQSTTYIPHHRILNKAEACTSTQDSTSAN